MIIPDKTVYPSRLRAYGTQGFTMDGIAEEAGCPRVYKLKYVEHKLKEPSSYALDYGSLVHEALYLNEEHDLPLLPEALDEAFARTTLPLGPEAYDEAVRDLSSYMERRADNLATIAVEQHLTAPLVEIDGDQYLMGGYIDRLAIDPDDPMSLYVVDYKTNRAPARQSDVDAWNQGTHYAAVVRANIDKYMPGVDPLDVRIVVVWDAIKWTQVYSERQHWQLDQYEDWARAMTRRIVMDEAGDPVLNDSCNYCPAKYDCSEFRKLPGRGNTIADRLSTTTDLEQRVYLMQQAQLTIKALKGAVDDVKKELEETTAASGEPIVINGIRYELSDDWGNDWDIPKLFDVLGQESFFSVVSVTGYKVDAVVKKNPELAEDVESCKTRYLKEKRRLTAKRDSQ